MATGARVSVKVDDAALRTLLRSRSGPVVADLLRRGVRVQNRARVLAPVDTGRLRNSITHELRSETGNPVVRVGTNVVYAPHVHEGTRTADGAVRMKARPFLRDAMDAAR